VQLIASVREKRDVSKTDRGLVFWDARLVKQDGTTMCQGQMIRMVRRRDTAAGGLQP
jgi:acyl dehydratase